MATILQARKIIAFVRGFLGKPLTNERCDLLLISLIWSDDSVKAVHEAALAMAPD